MLLRLSIFVGLFAVIMALLMLPEIAFRSLAGTANVVFSGTYLGIITLFTLAMLLDHNLRWSMVTLIVVSIIFLIQFSHEGFFGRAVSPYSLVLMGQEISEIFDTVVVSLAQFWWVPVLGIVPSVTIFLLLRFYRPFGGLKFIGILPLIILSFGIYRQNSYDDISRAFPTVHHPAIQNFVAAAGGVIFIMPKQNQNDHLQFKEYEVSKYVVQPAEDTTVVVVFGESWNGNHFSALGYERDTTPRVQQLLTESDQHKLNIGISSSTSTRMSSPMFFNTIRDPRDSSNIYGGIGNLFTLAKKQGFETYYYSAQKINLLGTVHTGDIDNTVTKDSNVQNLAEKMDEELISLVNAIDFSESKKRFIVLHTRSAHTPYEEHLKFRPELKLFPVNSDLPNTTRKVNLYDNSLRYSDFIIEQLYRAISDKTEGSLYFWLTSDHGEMMDHNGMFGHIHLDMAAVEVPIGLFSKNADQKIVQEFKAASHLTHWDLSRFVLKSTGLVLNDPNPEVNVRYVSGAGNFGSHGILKIEPLEKNLWNVERL